MSAPDKLFDISHFLRTGLGILPAKQARVPSGLRVLEMMLMKDRGLTVADWRDHRPLIVIAGCGMSGVALALALQQRGMRAVIYEKDARFDSRSQGYGLTIQQVPALIPLFCYSSFVTVCTGCGCVEPAMCRHFGRQHQQ